MNVKMNEYKVGRSHSIYEEDPTIEVVKNIDNFSPGLLAEPGIEDIEAQTIEEAYEIYKNKHNLNDPLADWCVIADENKYEVFLSSDYYIGKDGYLDWASDTEDLTVSIKHLGYADTPEDAMQLIYNSGRLQDIYPSSFVYTEKDGEVYSSIPAKYECECCNHEEWERVETDDLKGS